jgi:hypothetical protein
MDISRSHCTFLRKYDYYSICISILVYAFHILDSFNLVSSHLHLISSRPSHSMHYFLPCPPLPSHLFLAPSHTSSSIFHHHHHHHHHLPHISTSQPAHPSQTLSTIPNSPSLRSLQLNPIPNKITSSQPFNLLAPCLSLPFPLPIHPTQ